MLSHLWYFLHQYQRFIKFTKRNQQKGFSRRLMWWAYSVLCFGYIMHCSSPTSCLLSPLNLHRDCEHLLVSILRTKKGQDGEFETNHIANNCWVWIDRCPDSILCNWSYAWGDCWMDLPCVFFMCFCSTFGSSATSD